MQIFVEKGQWLKQWLTIVQRFDCFDYFCFVFLSQCDTFSQFFECQTYKETINTYIVVEYLVKFLVTVTICSLCVTTGIMINF